MQVFFNCLLFIFNLDQIKVCSLTVVRIIYMQYWIYSTWYLLTCIQEQHFNQFYQLMTYYTKDILYRKLFFLIYATFIIKMIKKITTHLLQRNTSENIFKMLCIIHFILSQILIYTSIFKWIHSRFNVHVLV